MKEVAKESYSLYDLSRQAKLIRREHIRRNALDYAISFYDLTVRSNSKSTDSSGTE
jgi:hypothetical protein